MRVLVIVAVTFIFVAWLGWVIGLPFPRTDIEQTVEIGDVCLEDSLSTVFVDEMKVAEYIAPVMRRRILEIESKPPEETPEDGIAESSVSLVDSPKHWQGLTIREKDSLVEVKIKDVLRGGRVQLSSGEIISYQRIRKDWEIV